MAIEARGVTPLLEVFDMRQSMAFYRDMVGFSVVHMWEPDGHLVWAMLKLGDATIMLNERYEEDQRPAAPDSARAAGHADAELYFDCADVDAAHAHLKDKGCPVSEPVVTYYGMKQIWISDPDGFQLCFQQPVAAQA